MSKYERGVCPECKVKENDSSKKILYQCKSCERWFCAKHFEPRLVHIPDYDAFARYPEVKVTLEEEWRREDGHPDFAYSLKRFQELDMEEKIHSKLIETALNRSKAYRKKTLKATHIRESLPVYTDIQAKSKTETQCPKCGSGHTMCTAYREKFSHLQCLNCGFKWKQRR